MPTTNTTFDTFDLPLQDALQRMAQKSEATRPFIVLYSTADPSIFVQWTGSSNNPLLFDCPPESIELVPLDSDYVAQARAALISQFGGNPGSVPMTLQETSESTTPRRTTAGVFVEPDEIVGSGSITIAAFDVGTVGPFPRVPGTVLVPHVQPQTTDAGDEWEAGQPASAQTHTWRMRNNGPSVDADPVLLIQNSNGHDVTYDWVVCRRAQ